MDIPPHILQAVHTLDTSPRKRIGSISTNSRRSPKSTAFSSFLKDGRSSVGDLSTTSDSSHDNDYQTDFTTPASSDSSPEDMQPDDVEDFRDREYPQLKGKTYLDHGGSTVCTFIPFARSENPLHELVWQTLTMWAALREVSG